MKEPLQWRFWCPLLFFGMSGMESITGKVKNICESFALKPPKNKSFLSVALLTFWAGQFFVVGSCPVHCGMLNSVPGLHPLDAGSTLSQVETTEGDSKQSRIAPLLSTILKTSSQPHYRLCIHFNIRVDQIDDQLPNTKSTSKWAYYTCLCRQCTCLEPKWNSTFTGGRWFGSSGSLGSI